MKKIQIKQYGKKYNLQLFVTSYCHNGNMAIIAYSNDEPYVDLTVNFDETLPVQEAYVNVNGMPNIVQIIEEFATAKGITKRSGYVEYPLYRFDLSKMKEYILPDSDYPFIEVD